MPLKSMALTSKEQKSDAMPKMEKQKYPYGLTMHLDEEVMSKLGLKDLPEVGTKLVLAAVVNVESVS